MILPILVINMPTTKMGDSDNPILTGHKVTKLLNYYYMISSEDINELARLKPKEILLAEKYRASELASQIGSMLNMRISFQVDSFFAVNKCRKNLLDFYQINVGDFYFFKIYPPINV